MEDSAFSGEFCWFLKTMVPSVAAAELLLFLANHSDRWWDVKEIVANLPPGSGVMEEEVWKFLDLQSRQLVAVGPDKRVQYRAASAHLDGLVRTLAQAYNERPVTLVRVIYGLRDPAIQSFADAFRLRKG